MIQRNIWASIIILPSPISVLHEMEANAQKVPENMGAGRSAPAPMFSGHSKIFCELLIDRWQPKFVPGA